MIDVRFFRKSGRIISVTYDGHAEYDTHGKDIVCAAVTAQCMMAYNGIDQLMRIPNQLDLKPDGGYLSFSIDKASLDEQKKAQLLMETLHMGIKAVEMQYGNFIKLSEEEV